MNIEYEPYQIGIKLGEKYKSDDKNRFGDTLGGLYLSLTNDSAEFQFGRFEKMTLGTNRKGPGWAVLNFHPNLDCDAPLSKAMTHLGALGLEAQVMDSDKAIDLTE